VAAQFRRLGSRSKRAPQLLSRQLQEQGASDRKPNRSLEKSLFCRQDYIAMKIERESETGYAAGAALTVSGDPATPTSANYGTAPVTVTGNHFTLTVPVKRGENDFSIDGSSKNNNFVFAITR
jgi:hypothetical protein